MTDWKIDGKPALLVLHMQRGIIGERSEVIKLVESRGIVPRIKSLLEAFRDKNLPVIYVNVMKKPPVCGTFPTPAYGFLWQEMGDEEPDPKNLEVVPELAPLPGEPLLINWPFGAFHCSGLDEALRINDVRTVVITGFSTNGVVLNAILGAADRYYSIVVPSDASATPLARAHQVIMEEIAPACALVTTTEDVIAHL